MAPVIKTIAVVVLLLAPRLAVAGETGDAELFGDKLTVERGERLRLASELDPAGWPELRALARSAADAREIDVSTISAIAKLDERIAALGDRMKPKLRQAPLEALEELARADLAMLRAAGPESAVYCGRYLWPYQLDPVSLRRSARSVGREAELARLRALRAAATLRAQNPTYYDTQVSEEQEQLRGNGLSAAEIAFATANSRPPGVDDATACRTTIRYLDAVLDYPAELRSTTLAWRMSGDYGDGDD